MLIAQLQYLIRIFQISTQSKPLNASSKVVYAVFVCLLY